MTSKFVREERYIVFKLSDVERYLTYKDRADLATMKSEIDAGRDCANKPPFNGLIVESDWPEYEPTWRAIEARVTGAQPAPSVPECPYPCGWRSLLKLAIEDGAYLARSINEDEPVTENARAVTMRMVMRLRDVLMAINNAAPEAKP